MKPFIALSAGIMLFVTGMLNPQTTMAQSQTPPVIFAVINDGTTIEPIAIRSNGTWTPAIGGEQGSMELAAFASKYYTPKTSYNLFTGGKATGKAVVVSNDPEAECSGAMATVKCNSPKLKLKGFDMALASNLSSSKPASGVRRTATAAEKTTIDKLATAAFRSNKVVVKNLKAVRLTVLDTDNDKVNEIVGTYTTSPSAKERGLLFFIAVKNKAGQYEISFSSYNHVKETEVMNQEIGSVDDGIYQEMLLDVIDTDNSGAGRIFTTTLSFEGVGFNMYEKKGGKWEKALEVSNYHCAF